MGKPAARVTDLVSNAGMITGPGAPTVLINGLPAARLGDMHTTPMVIPGTPPGPILKRKRSSNCGKRKRRR
jgi:uncharacterized Zn-binding protein involved in type VI secretion